jgi:hypothetical protein
MFKKILGYFKYRKMINDNFDVISNRYKFRYDRLYGRLYTVIGIDKDRQEVLKTYGYEYLDGEVKKFLTSLDTYFSSIGMIDSISISRVDSIDPVNVLIVLRYRYKNHQRVLYTFLFIVGLVSSTAIIALFYKFMLFLINFIIYL